MLETTRLILRPLTDADAPSIQNAVSDRAIADAMISIPHPYPNGEAERYIAQKIAEFDAGLSITFAIKRKFDFTLSGIIEIREINREHAQAELSFWLAVEAGGQGYMSEALKPVLQFGLEAVKLNRHRSEAN